MALLQRFVGGVIADALCKSVMGVDAGIRIPQSRKKDESPKGSRDLRQRVTPEVGSGTAIEGFLAVPLARYRLHGFCLRLYNKICSIRTFPGLLRTAITRIWGYQTIFYEISRALVPALEYFCLIRH